MIDLLRHPSVSSALHAVAGAFADRVALVDRHRTWSYSQFDERVSALARHLLNSGVRPGAHCGLLMDNSAEHVIAHFGALRAGLVVIPLNPRHHPREWDQQISETDVDVLLLSPELLRRASAHSIADFEKTAKYVIFDPEAGLDGSAEPEILLEDLPTNDCPFPVLQPSDPSIIWHTSGTTGRPKGVIHDNRSSLHAAAAWIKNWNLGSADRSLVKNLFHVGMTGTVLAPLLAGSSLAMMHRNFSLVHLLEDLADYRVTFFAAAPAMLSLFDQNQDLVRKYDLSALRVVNTGSAPIDVALFGRVIALLPDHVQWTQSYGQTELNTGGCCLSWSDFHGRIGSIGKPIDCVDAISIRDANGDEVATGEIGELCIQGPTVAKGYYDKAMPTPEQPQARGWHHTGDLARVDAQGFYWLVGRKRDLIIRGGENIYPSEVERVLHSHPSVQEAVVVGLPDSVMGEVPIAFVEARGRSVCDAAVLKAHCQENLARYKCPTHIEVVATFPRNDLGKVLRTELSARALGLVAALGR